MDLAIRKSVLFDVTQRPFLRGDPLTFKTLGVTIDAAQVPLVDGKKIVAAGCIIGRQSNGKYKRVTIGTRATRVLGTGNGAFQLTAKRAGAEGNFIGSEVRVSGNSTPLSVDVVGNDITVNSATDVTGVATSTAAAIRDAINALPEAAALVTADLPSTSDGTGVTGAVAKANLEGGADPGVGLSAFVVLFDVADVTRGDAVFGAFDSGAVIESRMPDAVNGVVPADVKALLPHVIFA